MRLDLRQARMDELLKEKKELLIEILGKVDDLSIDNKNVRMRLWSISEPLQFIYPLS
jgi:hypothetical protein